MISRYIEYNNIFAPLFITALQFSTLDMGQGIPNTGTPVFFNKTIIFLKPTKTNG